MNIQKPVTVLSSREFNQDTARAKRAALKNPVFITTRGEVSHVLMTKEDFDRMEAQGSLADSGEGRGPSLLDMVADDRPEAKFEFTIPENKEIWKGFRFD